MSKSKTITLNRPLEDIEKDFYKSLDELANKNIGIQTKTLNNTISFLEEIYTVLDGQSRDFLAYSTLQIIKQLKLEMQEK